MKGWREERECALHDDEGSHRLDDGNSTADESEEGQYVRRRGEEREDEPRNNARVVATAGRKGSVFSVVLGRLLFLRDGSRRLEGAPASEEGQKDR